MTANSEILSPPIGGAAGLYLAGDDHLRVTSFNSAASVRLSIVGRQLLATGRVVSSADAHTPNTDRTAASSLLTMAEGWLQSVSVFASGGTPRDGQCFVLVEIVRGRTGAVTPLGLLVSGYVTDTQPLGWPGTPIRRSAQPPGAVRAVTGTDPAAGVEISETVPTNARWRLLSLLAALVTDATVANREAALVVDDGTNNQVRAPAGVNHAASLTRTYNFHPWANRFTIAQDATITPPIPDLWLPGGFRIQTITTNLQAGDNWGAPQLLIEELIED